MRVLMIGPDRSVHGGISGVVNNYYEAGLDKKIDLCYIGTMVEGSKVRKLLKAAGAFAVFLWKLPGYEIVHVNVASDASYVRKSFFIRAAKAFHKKTVIHQHGGDFEGYYRGLSDKGKERVREVLAMGDAFLVLAPPWKEFFGGLIDKDKITVFPDSIQIPEKEEKRYGQHKLLFLGRICKAKGVGELLSVVPLLKEKCPDIKLYLGGIFEEKELEDKVRELSDCVKWLGWISGDEKKKYLKECDIFVLPSYFEGQSVSVLEAMAYSCAVVASNTGGIPQMIINGETGILTEPRSEEALKEGLNKVLSDTALCESLGRNAYDKVEKEFSIDSNMEELLKIYESILKR
ncbi:MAG: glycosyltransferase family 4 protein [Lachnospiraceae bacterium]|nr:glycosyltransferase family 4 protein [Lachnospiraceae bacterium]